VLKKNIETLVEKQVIRKGEKGQEIEMEKRGKEIDFNALQNSGKAAKKAEEEAFF
jgi:hypothetical protein